MIIIFLLKYGNRSIEFGSEASKADVEEDYNKKITDELEEITSAQNGELPKYNITVNISDITKRVYEVICTERW
mgnify:FL=1